MPAAGTIARESVKSEWALALSITPAGRAGGAACYSGILDILYITCQTCILETRILKFSEMRPQKV